jgi:hypothetical protein
MAEQSVTLAPGESKAVSFEAIPTEVKTYQVSVDGLTGSFRAIEAAPPSGQLLEITWRDGGVWHPISEPMPASTTITHRFRVRNTGGRATFKVGISYWDAFQGRYVWSYSPSVNIEPGEGNIDWNIWTGAPATRSIEFHLFANDTEVDVMTATVRVV